MSGIQNLGKLLRTQMHEVSKYTVGGSSILFGMITSGNGLKLDGIDYTIPNGEYLVCSAPFCSSALDVGTRVLVAINNGEAIIVDRIYNSANAGRSNDADEFVVQIVDDGRNATVENPDHEITCSCTYAEVFAAIDGGKHLRATLKYIQPCGSTVYAYFYNSRDVTVYDYDSEVRNGEITFEFGVSHYYYLSPDDTISC